MLAIQAGRKPAMIVPVIERPDAEAAAGRRRPVGDRLDRRPGPLRGGGGTARPGRPLRDLRLGLGHAPARPAAAAARARATSSMTAALPMLRAVKDADELDAAGRRRRRGRRAFRGRVRMRFSGRRELDVASDLADLLREHGHSEVDFTLVGSGPTAPTRTTRPVDRVIEQGDMVVLDFGGIKDGYGSDITRTVHVGEPTAEEREVYDVVHRAQQAGVRGGAPGRRLPGDRPGRPDGDHRRRLRRAVHPPRRPRDRADQPRAAVHGRGRGPAARARDVLLDRAGDLPARAASASGSRTSSTVTEDGGRSLNSTGHELQIVS